MSCVEKMLQLLLQGQQHKSAWIELIGTGDIPAITTWDIPKPIIHTPRKINMEPENTPLEEESHLQNHPFSGGVVSYQAQLVDF